jgi:hypothetical protein
MVFFHTISKKIHYRTTQWIPNRELDTYQKALDVVIKLYKCSGFRITWVHADDEFDPVLKSMIESEKYSFAKI